MKISSNSSYPTGPQGWSKSQNRWLKGKLLKYEWPLVDSGLMWLSGQIALIFLMVNPLFLSYPPLHSINCQLWLKAYFLVFFLLWEKTDVSEWWICEEKWLRVVSLHFRCTGDSTAVNTVGNMNSGRIMKYVRELHSNYNGWCPEIQKECWMKTSNGIFNSWL